MINNEVLVPGVYKPMKFSFFFLLAILWNNVGHAQPVSPKSLLHDISFYADVMVNATADDHRALAYDRMTEAMDALLKTAGSYDVSLDSIPWISVLHGDDFRLVTWQWKVNEEEYKYGGFYQTQEKVVPFKDSRPFLNGSSRNTYSPSAWYGALYYQMIPFERDKKKYYVLLGFNAENSYLNTKVADVLDVSGNELVFGVPVFVGKEDPMTRIILTYADVSTVHIRYDEEFGGIIYDHIEQLPGMSDSGQAMPVADGSLEGWKLKGGEWRYNEEVYDVKVDTPPMMDDRKDRKEDKDILGRPKKE